MDTVLARNASAAARTAPYRVDASRGAIVVFMTDEGTQAGSGTFSYRVEGQRITWIERPFVEWPKVSMLLLFTVLTVLFVTFCCTCGFCRQKPSMTRVFMGQEKSVSDIPPPFDDELAIEDFNDSLSKSAKSKSGAIAFTAKKPSQHLNLSYEDG